MNVQRGKFRNENANMTIRTGYAVCEQRKKDKLTLTFNVYKHADNIIVIVSTSD